MCCLWYFSVKTNKILQIAHLYTNEVAQIKGLATKIFLGYQKFYEIHIAIWSALFVDKCGLFVAIYLF